jgi:hypothetical protein
MPRLSKADVRDAITGSAINAETTVITLSNGMEVPFTVIPWVHHKAMEDVAIRGQVAAQLNGGGPTVIDAATLGLAGIVERSVLDHDGSRIFASVAEADAWLASLSGPDLELVEQAAQHVREATSLAGPIGTSLAEVGKASSRTTLP